MSLKPKWVRQQEKAFRGHDAQWRRLRWLWRHQRGRDMIAELVGGNGIVWRPEARERF